MLDAVATVGVDLVGFGIAADRGDVLLHLLGRVGVTGRLLHRGPATEIEMAAGQQCGAAGDTGALRSRTSTEAPAVAASTAAHPPEMPHAISDEKISHLNVA